MWRMHPQTLFARAVLAPAAKGEIQKQVASLDGDRVRKPRNLLQRATMRV